MSNSWRAVACAILGWLLVPAALLAAAPGGAQKTDKDSDSKRPKINLKAQPMIAMSPARVVLTAEIVGGPNDYEEFYCPTIEWDWGDGTQSESTSDCAPYEPGKSEIKRRFTASICSVPGSFAWASGSSARTKAVGFATVSLQIRPGLRETGQ